MQANFDCVLSLLRLKVSSPEKAVLLLITVCFLMLITNLNIYLNYLKGNYPSMSTESFSFSAMENLRYLDIGRLIGYSESVSVAVAVICLIYMIGMVLLYLVCFLNKYYRKNSKPRKYFFGHWFVNMVNVFT